MCSLWPTVRDFTVHASKQTGIGGVFVFFHMACSDKAARKSAQCQTGPEVSAAHSQTSLPSLISHFDSMTRQLHPQTTSHEEDKD